MVPLAGLRNLKATSWSQTRSATAEGLGWKGWNEHIVPERAEKERRTQYSHNLGANYELCDHLKMETMHEDQLILVFPALLCGAACPSSCQTTSDSAQQERDGRSYIR